VSSGDGPENRGPKRPMPPESGRFRPGVSGNPGGRPGSAPVAAAYRKFLQMPLKEIQSLDSSKLTGAELLALATLKAAWKGRTLAAVEATDRSEGKVLAVVGSGTRYEDWTSEQLTARVKEILEDARERARRAEEQERQAAERALPLLPEPEPDA
jgi:hypothetical protein